MGGIGKTQLACEFAYRYGRYFAGGVFWLNMGEPGAAAAEVAACGGAKGMALQPGFGNLPLEEQVGLVSAAWQNALPRLLVFDNCEDEALLLHRLVAAFVERAEPDRGARDDVEAALLAEANRLNNAG